MQVGNDRQLWGGVEFGENILLSYKKIL